MFNRLTQALTTFTQINNRYSRLPDSKRSWLALPDISSVIESNDNFRIIVALVPEYSTGSPDALDSMGQDDVYTINTGNFLKANLSYTGDNISFKATIVNRQSTENHEKFKNNDL